MENRFGVKDLIVLVALAVLGLLVLAAMKQYDRQWEVIQSIQKQGDDQLRELVAIRRAVENGVRMTPTTNQALTEGADPFRNLRKAKARPDYAMGDWLIDNFGVKVATLTPVISSDVYATVVQSRVQESLVYRDPMTLEYLPLLATSWQISDNTREWEAFVEAAKKAGRKEEEILKDPTAPPAIRVTFQLRQGVTYSDGVPMTADDVVYTYDWIMNPAVNAPRDRAYLENIRAVRKLSTHEVLFEFRRPYFESFELAGGFQPLARHFYSRFSAEEFNKHPGLLLGTGPYKLRDPESWRPGTRIELVRNERYWGEPNPFDKLVYLEVETEAVEMTMFRNGEFDIFAAQPEQYQSMMADRDLVSKTHQFEYLSPTGGYTYIAWNQKRGGKTTWFADRRVRQAMTLLTDRPRMCKEIMLGYAMPATGPFSPLSKQADPSITAWPYDPQRAQALLAEAGFTREGDGLLKSSSGEAMRIKLTYFAKNKLSERIALFLKDTYARAGVALEPDPTDWPIMIKKLQNRDFDAITLGWTGGIETDIYQMFHSSQMKDNGDDFMSYENPELDRLIEEARKTLDEDKRIPLWRKCHRILHEDQPYTFVFDRKSLVFLDKRLANVERSKIGLNYAGRYIMPISWYVPRAAQKWTR